MAAVTWILAHYQEVLTGLSAVVGGLIAISLIVPGDQPEKALQGFADFLAKFSKK